MLATVIAPADQTPPATLRALIESYVTQYAAGEGDVLRLTGGERDLEALFNQVADVLASLGRDPEDVADIEIVPGTPAEVARPGNLVLVCNEAEPWALNARGAVPLETAAVPAAPRSATEALRRVAGYANLAWIAETRDPSGHASEARMYLQALDDAGLEPALTWPTYPPSRIPLSFSSERLLFRCQQRRPAPSGTVAVWHRQPERPEDLASYAATACRTMWETDTLPAHWPALLNRYDRVWVPTDFHVDVFAAAGVDEARIKTLPQTVDFGVYAPTGERREFPGCRGFIFLSAFEFQERKGWRPLLEAYAREFSDDDDVTLLLKVETNFADLTTVGERIDAFVAGLGIRTKRLPHIALFHDRVSDGEMAAMFRGCDAYVSPTRGEGWGRPLMEALACGLPVITSRWSGPLAFLDDSSAWLVDGSLIDVPSDVDLPMFRGGRWFDPDIDGLRAAMRSVASAPAEAKRKTLAARPSLLERFSHEAIADRVAELVLDAL